MAAALMFGAFGSSLALADPDPQPAPTSEAPTATSEAPTPNTETATPVAPSSFAPVPAGNSSSMLCGVIRGNKTQIDDTTWPLKVATKSEGWDWADVDVRDARTRIDGQLPALLNNLQAGLSKGSGDVADSVRDAVAAGKDLIATIDHNGDGGDTAGALGAFDKALNDSLRACIEQS